MPAIDTLIKRLSWDDLDVAHLRRFIELVTEEDVAGLGMRDKPARTGDQYTDALAAAPSTARAALTARNPLVACGLPLIPHILAAYGKHATGQPVARVG